MPATASPAILISACLFGQPVRYDARAVPCPSALLDQWRQTGLLLPFCPETAGGLPVPRLPAEIGTGGDGRSVLAGAAKVIDRQGRDLSPAFVAGAHAALQAAERHGIRLAILKEDSPSCGSSAIHAGRFDGQTVAGQGVTAALLRDVGLRVFNEHDIAAAAAFLREISPIPAVDRSKAGFPATPS